MAKGKSLADVHGVATKALNQAVRRNEDSSDFRFQLTEKENEYVVTNCDHIRKPKAGIGAKSREEKS